MSAKKSRILDLQPVERDGKTTYLPVRDTPSSDLLEGDAAPLMASYPQRQPRTVTELKGSYTDRAKAFSLKTWQVSIIAGLGLYLLGRLTVGYPWLGVGAILTLLGGVAAVWFGAYLLDLLFSPEGAEIADIFLFWRYMAREQRERHERNRRDDNHRGGSND